MSCNSSIIGAYYRLWDYEVVEIFFLSSKDNMYLEVEFGPHGHHLGLLLNGRQKCIKHSFPIDYKAEIGKWNLQKLSKDSLNISRMLTVSINIP